MKTAVAQTMQLQALGTKPPSFFRTSLCPRRITSQGISSCGITAGKGITSKTLRSSVVKVAHEASAQSTQTQDAALSATLVLLNALDATLNASRQNTEVQEQLSVDNESILDVLDELGEVFTESFQHHRLYKQVLAKRDSIVSRLEALTSALQKTAQSHRTFQRITSTKHPAKIASRLHAGHVVKPRAIRPIALPKKRTKKAQSRQTIRPLRLARVAFSKPIKLGTQAHVTIELAGISHPVLQGSPKQQAVAKKRTRTYATTHATRHTENPSRASVGRISVTGHTAPKARVKTATTRRTNVAHSRTKHTHTVNTQNRSNSYPNSAVAGIRTGMAQGHRSHASNWGMLRRPDRSPLARSRDVFMFERRDTRADARLVAVPAMRGDATVREYVYRRPQGDVFAGWEERGAQVQIRPTQGTYALPAPLSHIVQSGVVVGMGTTAGDTLPEYENDEDQLVAAIIEQLRQGPDSLNADSPLAAGAHHALYYALLHAPQMDERGARMIPEIYADAAKMLGIDMATFARWEDFLGADDMLSSIARDPKQFSQTLPQLGAGIRQKIEEFVSVQAGRIFGGWNEINALTHDQEMVLEWLVIKLTNKNSTDRVTEAASHIRDLYQQNFKAATRLLSLIVKNSTLNETRPQPDAVVKRWNDAQTTRLMELLMTDGLDDVLSHRSFRAHLTEEENRAINQGVPRSTLGWRYDRMSGVDINDDTAFNATLKEIDEDGSLQDEAIRRMIEAFQRMN